MHGKPSPSAAVGAATTTAAGPAVVQASHGEIIIIAVLALDFRGAQTQRNATDANIIVLGGVSDNAGLAMMPYLGSDLASTTT